MIQTHKISMFVIIAMLLLTTIPVSTAGTITVGPIQTPKINVTQPNITQPSINVTQPNVSQPNVSIVPPPQIIMSVPTPTVTPSQPIYTPSGTPSETSFGSGSGNIAIDPWKPTSKEVFMQVIMSSNDYLETPAMRFSSVRTSIYYERYAIPISVNIWNATTLKPKSGVKVKLSTGDCYLTTTFCISKVETKTTDSSGQVRFGYVIPFNSGEYTISIVAKNSAGVDIADYWKRGVTSYD